MLVSKKAVKDKAKKRDKQASGEFIMALDKKVDEIIERAIQASNHHKRLKASDILVLLGSENDLQKLKEF